jgi:hypothetical protein
MSNGIGWNIHLSYCTDEYVDQLIAELKRTQPSDVLLLDSFGDCVGDTLRFARELPETTIIYRRFVPDDQQFNRSIEQWGAEASPFRGTRVYVSTTNEPNPRQSFDYLTRAIKYAKANGIKIAVGAYSVGTPHESDMPLAVSMLREMAAYPGGTLLEVHEYERALMAHTIAPHLKMPSQWPSTIDYGKTYFRLMRFREWLRLCALNLISAPKIVVTEWGWDRVDDVPPHVYGDTQGLMTLPGTWQTWGFSDWEKYAADQLKWAWEKFYKPYNVGVCFFCRHNQPVDQNDPEKLWQNFNAHRAPNFLKHVETGFSRMTAPTQPPTYKPYVEGKYTLSGNGVRTRTKAGTDEPINGTWNTGAVVYVQSRTITHASGFGWQEVHVEMGGGYVTVGMMALHGADVTWKLTPAPFTPEPEPDRYAALAAQCRATSAVLRAEADKLDAIATEAEAL